MPRRLSIPCAVRRRSHFLTFPATIDLSRTRWGCPDRERSPLSGLSSPILRFQISQFPDFQISKFSEAESQRSLHDPRRPRRGHLSERRIDLVAVGVEARG